MDNQALRKKVAALTLEEKASLCSGADNWYTKAIARLGISACRTSDGPHGLRTQNGEMNSLAEGSSMSAVCFPSGSASAASFNPALLQQMGEELGNECQAAGVNVLLGPGVNGKRSPLCGRNFEYFSEDPLLAGTLGAAFVNGLQSKGVGASLKHFFANSQEHHRMNSSSEMDARTMREIYLRAFELVVKNAQPWTVMAAYNQVGGIHCTAHKRYLTDVLRGEWGFEGLVMSDWGATHDRVAAVQAGCDLTMPAEATDHLLVQAVQDGRLEESALDDCCVRVLALAEKSMQQHKQNVTFDYEGGHALARKIAAESMVLLKNEGALLPLSKSQKIAFIGGFADKPRYQGGGSSHINSFRVVGALQAAQAAGYMVEYAQGYLPEGTKVDEALIAQAVCAAKAVDVAVVFAGLPETLETEGVDRHHLKMPESHNRLIEAVSAANANTVVVLHNGAPVEMPWVSAPKAILEAYLGGQAVGEATVDILYGTVNPSGHLAETFPKKLADTPAHLFYFGEGQTVHYSERCFVGYRYYTSKEMEPLFPFGHGLSYTQFAYSALALDKTEMQDTESLVATVTVTNSGTVEGNALVQLYIAPPRKEVLRPVRELKGFQKIPLKAGESKTVSFCLSKRDFAHWSEAMDDWRVESGEYAVQICENAHCVMLACNVMLQGTQPLRPVTFSMDMPMGDFAKIPQGRKALDENIGHFICGMAAAGFLPQEAAAAMQAMGDDKIDLATVELLAEKTGMTAAGASGISVLFGQPLSMLINFIPSENAEKLKLLVEQCKKAYL